MKPMYLIFNDKTEQNFIAKTFPSLVRVNMKVFGFCNEANVSYFGIMKI